MADEDCPVIVIAGRRRPHEVSLLAISLILGVAYLAGTPRPNSLQAYLPLWAFYGWAVALVAVGAGGLIGCYWPGRRDIGLEIERVAMLAQASTMTIYVGALFALSGWKALGAGLIAAAWVYANTWRALQISRDLRAIERGVA